MSVATYQHLSWQDDHSLYLNELYSLYCRDIHWEDQLCNVGYRGYPDPAISTNGSQLTPDFLAISERERDVQYIDVCGTKLSDSPSQELEEQIQEVSTYRDIEDRETEQFLELHDVSISPAVHEPVALFSESVYQENQGEIDSCAEDLDVNIWTVSLNGAAEFSLSFGSHANLELEDRLKESVRSYPLGGDLIQYTRNTDVNLLKFEFTQRLVNHCFREKKRKFEFEEVDRIMADMRPPLLGHLTPSEREDYWRDFLHTLLARFELLETSAQNEYTWKKKRFLREPRYCRQILDGVREDLELGEDS